jgi:activating signal cointegrator complex subunit 1
MLSPIRFRYLQICTTELYLHRCFNNMGRRNKAASKKKINAAPKKAPLTHFLCVPLVNSISKPQLEASIRKFKEHVCSTTPVKTAQEVESTEESNASTLNADAVRPVGSLHLTLGVMSLDEGKLAQASTLLQSLDLEKLLRQATLPQASQINTTDTPNSAPSTPLATDRVGTTASTLSDLTLTLSLEGLEPMQSPTKTSILYIRPHDPTNRLEPLCQALRKTFTEAGLLVPDTRPLKLHATIINTIYIKGRKKNKKPKAQPTEVRATEPDQPPPTDTSENKEDGLQANTPNSGHGPSAKSSLYLDATSLLSTYRSYIWASDIPISKIAICEMGVKKQFSSTGEVVGEAYHEATSREI